MSIAFLFDYKLTTLSEEVAETSFLCGFQNRITVRVPCPPPKIRLLRNISRVFLFSQIPVISKVSRFFKNAHKLIQTLYKPKDKAVYKAAGMCESKKRSKIDASCAL